MKAFNAALLGHAFSSLAEYSQQAAERGRMSGGNTEPVNQQRLGDISLSLAAANVITIFLELGETKDAIKRLTIDMKSTVNPITAVTLHYALQSLLELMKNELDKRKVFALDPTKSKYYQDDTFGVKPPPDAQYYGNALLQDARPPEPLFSESAVKAFPSAYMDIVEAGRCLALNRNNAAIYHLMQVAEIGLRALARDRRVTVTRGKKQAVVPLEYAQWGEMIGQIQKKKDLIHQWPRSKTLKDEAVRYYTRAVFEVDSFNEIFRKHISHTRGELYEPDVAVSCWGHVYRFMDMLAEHMSENHRTPNVWNSPKNVPS
jgi:hypothetical protein